MGTNSEPAGGDQATSEERSDQMVDRDGSESQSPESDAAQSGPSRSGGSQSVAGVRTASRFATSTGGDSHRGDGYVRTEAGPDHERLSRQYGLEFVKDGEAERIQRLESEFSSERVHRWAAEGMPVDTMGKPRDMAAFRSRQSDRPEAVPTDIERQNQASRQRNVWRATDDGPAGEARAPDSVRQVVSSPGRSLDESVQREMASKMGEEFSDVRIHTGPQAARAAEALNARAFTVGNHVGFNRGEYRPNSSEGKRVLAHELTHVRQDTAAAVSLLPKAESDVRSAPVGDTHIQPKLEVSSPNDPAEKEAEEVADAVMGMSDSGGPDRTGTGAHRVNDSGATTHEESDGAIDDQAQPILHRTVPIRRSAAGEAVSGDAESSVRGAVQSAGKPLPSGTRSEFESKMGADLSDVAVHTGPKADAAAQSIDAKAYTLGSNIAFAKGNYNPESTSGKELLAHELTHVVQQGGAQRLADDHVDRAVSPATSTVYRAGMSMPGTGGQGGMSTSAALQDDDDDHPTYTVQEGDYLIKIAREQNVEGGVAELMALNRNNPNGRDVDDPDMIYAGQTLTLPKPDEGSGGSDDGGASGGGSGGGGGAGGMSMMGGGGMSMMGGGGMSMMSGGPGDGASEEPAWFCEVIQDADDDSGDGDGDGWTIPWPDNLAKASTGGLDVAAETGRTARQLYERAGPIQDAAEEHADESDLNEFFADKDANKMKGKPYFNVQGYPPEFEGGYKQPLFDKSIDLINHEIQLGATPFVAGVRVSVGAKANIALYIKGGLSPDDDEEWLPGQLVFEGGLKGDVGGEVELMLKAGIGAANVLTVGIEGGLEGTAALEGTAGHQGTFDIDENRQITGVSLDVGRLMVKPKLEVAGQVGPYVKLFNKQLDYHITIAEWDILDDPDPIVEVSLGEFSWSESDGFDAELAGIDVPLDELEPPDFPSMSEIFGSFTSWLYDVEDEMARETIESMYENDEIDELSAEHKAELLDMMSQGWWDHEFDRNVLKLLETEPNVFARRYLLFQMYVTETGYLPKSGERIHDWLDDHISNSILPGNNHWDELEVLMLGTDYENFVPEGFRRNPDARESYGFMENPNYDSDASMLKEPIISHSVYDNYVDQIKDAYGGMKVSG